MTRVIAAIARTTLLEALRSRMLWLVGALILLVFGIAGFLQQVALIEAAQVQGAIIAAVLRACAAFLVAAFVVMSMVREFNDKVFELLIAQPWPRAVYLLGKFAGFALSAVFLAVLASAPLAAFVPVERIPVWLASLACELVIVAAMSLFCVITLAHVVPSLAAVLGFYALARSIAALQIIAIASEGSASWSDRVANWILQGIALLLPRFDQMTQTAWLVATPPDPAVLASIFVQAAVYTVLLLSAAQFDLQRQNL
jgi:ABC-type transport system involved in multi-copper enzyme maturation permease subunit